MHFIVQQLLYKMLSTVPIGQFIQRVTLIVSSHKFVSLQHYCCTWYDNSTEACIEQDHRRQERALLDVASTPVMSPG